MYNMKPVNVRVDFLLNGDIIPLCYSLNNESESVNISRILNLELKIINNKKIYTYTCKVKNGVSKLLYDYYHWYIILSNF